MGNPTGFIEYERVETGHRPIPQRIKDWYEIDRPLVARILTEQAARCMDCGIPYCHAVGCPVKNRIPEFNDLVYRNRWREAAENLHSTNNFPEITGRVCPAPCEAACTLSVNSDPVTIKHIEYQIAERAFQEDWVPPLKSKAKTGKSVAVVGSGPAGLAAAQQLARLGHQAVIFEKDDRLGGLLRYGIPDFKMEKHVIDRRLEQMVAEGVQCEPNVEVGVNLSGAELRRRFDAVVLCMGAGKARPLGVPGADLGGVHLAMDFLPQQNRLVAGDPEKGTQLICAKHRAPTEGWSGRSGKLAASPFPIHAKGKHVIVIGGGDTGSDCVGTAIRQGALSVRQMEILPRPPEGKNPETPWPNWPKIMRTSSSQEEGCQRHWSALTKALTGANGQVTHLHGCEIDWIAGPKGWQMQERPGTDFVFLADLVLIAMGFLHVVHEGLIGELGVELDRFGNVTVEHWMTTVPGVFAAGDTVRGASLVVHAINHGRLAAAAVDKWLKTNAYK